MLIQLNSLKIYLLEIYAVMVEGTSFFDNFSSDVLFLTLSVESIIAPESLAGAEGQRGRGAEGKKNYR